MGISPTWLENEPRGQNNNWDSHKGELATDAVAINVCPCLKKHWQVSVIVVIYSTQKKKKWKNYQHYYNNKTKKTT